MKRFLTYGTFLLAIAVLPNFSIGILRMHAGDRIPYAINRDKSYVTTEQAQVKQPYQLFPVFAVTDMSRKPVWKDSILRSNDAFGFSNMVENRTPEILFIGDSYFNDPHFTTTEGIQATTNKHFQQNIAYNIGKSECAGFKVYNELNDCFFKKKPALIVFEVVERNAFDVITKAPAELRSNSFKTTPYKHYYADLLLGNNLKGLDKSKLVKKEKKPPVSGTVRTINGRKIWFLNNSLTEVSDPGLKTMVDSMKVIRDLLNKRQIQVLFLIGPDKESTYPALYGSSYLRSLQQKMRAQHLDFIDAHAALEGNGLKYYYDGDTHWNQQAINLVCDSVAKRYEGIFMKGQ